jgi:hypothetical protein
MVGWPPDRRSSSGKLRSNAPIPIFIFPHRFEFIGDDWDVETILPTFFWDRGMVDRFVAKHWLLVRMAVWWVARSLHCFTTTSTSLLLQMDILGRSISVASRCSS